MVNPLPNIKNSDWFKLKACTGNKVNFAEKLKFVPNDKILGWSKLKVFEDDDLNVAQMTEFVSHDRTENIVGKQRKCLLPAISPFPQCFQCISES